MRIRRGPAIWIGVAVVCSSAAAMRAVDTAPAGASHTAAPQISASLSADATAQTRYREMSTLKIVQTMAARR